MAIRQHGPKLNNAQSTKNQIGPIQYFPAKTDQWLSTGPVLMVWSGKQGLQLVSGYM